MRCLRKIANIRWQEQVPNTVVLQKCGTVGIEAIIIASQLRWVGHIARMPDERIPKRVFYGQLSSGQRSRGRPLLRYKDRLKDSLKACRMEISIEMAQDRPAWRRACHEGVERFEKARISNLEENVVNGKHLKQRDLQGSSPAISVEKNAALELDLYHTYVPTDDEIRRPRWLSPWTSPIWTNCLRLFK